MNLTLTQAGHQLTNNHNELLLPEWLHFNPESGELFGAPLEKKIYFIQVEAVLIESAQSSSPRTYEDIFVIEIVDPPPYLFRFINRNYAGFSSSSSIDGGDEAAKCRIELKHVIHQIDHLYKMVLQLREGADMFTTSFYHSELYQQNGDNLDKLKQWLAHFSVTPSGIVPSDSWKVFYEVEKCSSFHVDSGGYISSSDDSRTLPSTKNQNPIYLDQDSEKLLSRLSMLKIESELVKVSPSPATFNHLADSHSLNHPSSSIVPEIHQRIHRRRNAYVDDPDIYSTPTLSNEVYLSTSVIDMNQDFVLSRTLIPSMVSPTYDGPITNTATTPIFAISKNHRGGDFNHQPTYPHLYSTPVLMPDYSSLAIKSIEQIDQILVTPVLPKIESTSYGSSMFPDSPIVPSSSIITIENESNNQEENKKIREGELAAGAGAATFIIATSTTSIVSTSTAIPSSTKKATSETTLSTTSTHRPNHRPFVNRRIAKLSITAGKYWQYPIPDNTFMDKEDGNTQNLRLAFFKDSELPPIDYWIQFDHENQYLYALPTEENIGKYRFNLVAIDSNGAEVSETIEIYVRQPRESLTFTHHFVMANISWDSNLYVERIQAVSTLLQRMAIQVFEEISSTDPSEAVQRQILLHSISLLQIVQNSEKSW